MKIVGILLSLLIVVVSLVAASPCFAVPSQDFYRSGEDVLDDWHICRTSAFGENGFFRILEASFRPVIAFESLGEDVNTAYRLGEQFAENYRDLNQRAEKIFYFVRDRVRYTSDIDQFEHEEFAQNADELAMTIEEEGVGRGDCEDMAILLAVMYKGAGYPSAIVLPSGHAAALVYLPEYKKANVLEFEGKPGWIWAEATGKKNPFGWIPDQYKGATLAAYEISEESITVEEPPPQPQTKVTKTGGNIPLLSSPFLSVIALMWMMSMFRRGGRQRRPKCR